MYIRTVPWKGTVGQKTQRMPHMVKIVAMAHLRSAPDKDGTASQRLLKGLLVAYMMRSKDVLSPLIIKRGCDKHPSGLTKLITY